MAFGWDPGQARDKACWMADSWLPLARQSPWVVGTHERVPVGVGSRSESGVCWSRAAAGRAGRPAHTAAARRWSESCWSPASTTRRTCSSSGGRAAYSRTLLHEWYQHWLALWLVNFSQSEAEYSVWLSGTGERYVQLLSVAHGGRGSVTNVVWGSVCYVHLLSVAT